MPIFLANVDLNKNELRNARIQNLATAPSSPVTGQLYFDTDDGTLYYWDGSGWVAAKSGAPTGAAGGALSGTFPNPDLADAAVTNVKVAGGAAIAYSKLALSGSIVNGDIASGAAIALSKLATDPLARANHTGTQSADTLTDGSTNKAFLATERTKLAGVATGATANDTDANLKARANHTGTQTASTVSDFDTQVRTSRLDQMAAPTGSVSLNSQKITNLLDPTSDQEAATKAYTDAVAAGVRDAKDSVQVATTANITLSGEQTIDGVTTSASRVLVKDQSSAANNGIYVSAAGAWSRATDANSNAEVNGGMYVWVNEGTAQADTGWLLTTNDAITLGSTSLVFSQVSGLGQVTAGNGLTKSGNTIDAVGTSNRISVAADAIDISSSYVGQTSITTLGTITTGTWNGTDVAVADGGTGASTAAGAKTNLGFMGRYVASFGDGAATSFNIDHNLGTLDVIVQVYQNADGVEVECDVTRSTTNRVVLAVSTAPTSNALRVVVMG